MIYVQNRKIRNIKLIPFDDPEYVSFREKMYLKNFKLRSKIEPSFSQKVSAVVEEDTRQWIANSFTVSPERTLYFESLHRNNYIKHYQEIDVVIGHRDSPACFIEIKVSSNESRVQAGQNQLLRMYNVAKRIWNNLKLCVFFVSLLPENTINFPIYKLSNFDPQKEYRLWRDRISSIEDIPCIYLSANELWKWGVENNLHKDSSLLSDAIKEANTNVQLRKERELLMNQRVPKSEWPDYLKVKKEIPRDSKIYTIGNTSRNSDFADKLKMVLSK